MQTPTRPVIGFLTDFGLDGAAATCRAVMLSICPDAQIIDIAHTVRKYAVRDGAFILRSALVYFPVGVHVGVVDPGVGTDRRPIAIRAARGDLLIGPDNGLLVPAVEALGGLAEARVLTDRQYWLPVTSSTFHGRDIFSPVAAHLASGSTRFELLGPTVPLGALVRLPEARAVVTDGAIETEVTYVDSFGNVRLAAGERELRDAFGDVMAGSPFELTLGSGGSSAAAVFASSFGAVAPGTTLLYVDSSGNLAAADNQGSLGERLGVTAGNAARIAPLAD